MFVARRPRRRYNASAGQSFLKPHRDGSVVSFNIALNAFDAYEGGGTYIARLDEGVRSDRGHVLSHASGMLHGGHPITAGVRYILVAFVILKEYANFAYRFYERVRDLDPAHLEPLPEVPDHARAALEDAVTPAAPAPASAAATREAAAACEDGAVVWAKLGGYPFWPARVVPAGTPEDRACEPKGGERWQFVKFFGTHDFAWVRSDTGLKPFAGGERGDPLAEADGDLKDAIAEAAAALTAGAPTPSPT